MQHTQAWYRRTSAWVLAVLMLMSIGIVVGILAPSKSIAQNRVYVVEARGDATVFSAYPHRNFGERPRLVVDAYSGNSRVYMSFAIPVTSLIIDQATLVLDTKGSASRMNVLRTSPGWDEHGITRTNAPAGWRHIGSIGRSRAQRVGLDVTRFVTGSASTLSLVLVSHSGRTAIASSESGHGPKIKIHGHNASNTPTPTVSWDPSISPSSTPTSDPTPSATTDGRGFLTHCAVSHFAQVDPIVSPGHVSMHEHEFFGNTTTTANSTYDSMIAGTTTCDALADTAGYWVPTLLDPEGNVVSTGVVKVYYRDGGATSVTAFPPDLRMISHTASWFCGAGGEGTAEPQDCGAKPVRVRVYFPNCWDGVHLDSPDHMSHMTFDRGRDCTGVPVPAVLLNVVYPVNDGTAYTLSSGPPSTMHADFWNTWQQDGLQALVDRCINGSVTCGRIEGGP